MKNKYIKIASVVEILIGLIIGGLGVFMLTFSASVPQPTAVIGLIVGVPMIFLSILLIIFGINLLKFKKWAWSASVITLIITIAFFIFLKAYPQLIFLFLCLGAGGCLILLILGKVKK